MTPTYNFEATNTNWRKAHFSWYSSYSTTAG